jgi:pimeloyl-ACP methyl ester carboxylesterase
VSNPTPVVFENRDGNKLFGMLHRPPAARGQALGIVLLSPGVKMRVAPHRLYVMMATRLAELGYPVLRFDFYGLGDSEGELEDEYLADLYGTVSAGRFVSDTHSAMDWMQRECSIEQFVVGGLCGGAITGLLAGGGDTRIVGLLSLGIPVIRYSANIDPDRFVTRGQLKELRRVYFRKLLNPVAWVRLLTLRSDFRSIGRVVRGALAKPASELGIGQHPPPPDVGAESTNLNPLFAPAFFRMLDSDAKMILIFSGSDRLTWEYEEKFASLNKERLAEFVDELEVHTVPDANHIFATREWQQQMMALVEDWLKRSFPLAVQPGIAPRWS